MDNIRIPLHSFVDLITNSSSETFVAADRSTVSTLESIIDAILHAAGSTQRCCELFRIGLDTEDGGYGLYKTIYVEAREPNCRMAAKAIESLKEAFNPVWDDESTRRGERYKLSACTGAPKVVEDVINSVLDVVKSEKTCKDLFEVKLHKIKEAANQYEDPIYSIDVTSTSPASAASVHDLHKINTAFIAENVSSE